MTKINQTVQLDEDAHAHFSGSWGWCIRRGLVLQPKIKKRHWICTYGQNTFWADQRGIGLEVQRATFETLEDLKIEYAQLRLMYPNRIPTWYVVF